MESDDNYSELGSPEMSDITDERLRQALSTAQETHQLTPVIKEELRLTILNRRLNSGMEDFPEEVPETHRERKLSQEERLKKDRRREQNRVAAQRCRLKKKAKENYFKKELQTMQSRHSAMASEVQRLTAEKDELQRIIDEHRKVCSWSDFNVQNAQGVENVLPKESSINDLDSSVLNTIINFNNCNPSTNLTTYTANHHITATPDYNRDADSPQYCPWEDAEFRDIGEVSPTLFSDENFNDIFQYGH